MNLSHSKMGCLRNYEFLSRVFRHSLSSHETKITYDQKAILKCYKTDPNVFQWINLSL